jgi:hypothetical protein
MTVHESAVQEATGDGRAIGAATHGDETSASLRAAGFKLYKRPKVGEPIWTRPDDPGKEWTQTEALILAARMRRSRDA